MYGIIFWKGDQGNKDNKPYPYVNDDGTMVVIKDIVVADNMAFEIEQLRGVDARVISIEGVKE